MAPVAIVQSHETASAHEFAVTAFSGRPLSRTFGTSTRGLPTSREGFEMKDGSVPYLTTALGVDAGGTVHDPAILPNEEVTQTRPLAPAPGDSDAALDAARSWLAHHLQQLQLTRAHDGSRWNERWLQATPPLSVPRCGRSGHLVARPRRDPMRGRGSRRLNRNRTAYLTP
jgi:hypothetical protein